MSALVPRNAHGQFPPGVSGNPGGILRKLRDVQGKIIDKWSPEVDGVMARLLELTHSEDVHVAVSACREFLSHAAPAPKVDTRPAEGDDAADTSKLSDEEFWQTVLASPAVRQVALKVLAGGKP